MTPVPEEEPAIRAERLFARLTDQSGPGGEEPGLSLPPDAVVPVRVGEPTPPEVHPLSQRELRDFLSGARTAIERTANAVRVLRARATTTTADLRALGEAVEEALVATNARLTALEQHVRGQAGPGADAVEDALRRLRRTVRASEGSPEA